MDVLYGFSFWGILAIYFKLCVLDLFCIVIHLNWDYFVKFTVFAELVYLILLRIMRFNQAARSKTDDSD